MELNIQMSINIQKKKQENKKSYPEPDDGTQSERSHLTVIDGNVYQIRNQKTKSVKTKFNLVMLSILMEPKE
jgi:hypothetical protein